MRADQKLSILRHVESCELPVREGAEFVVVGVGVGRGCGEGIADEADVVEAVL